MRSSTNKSRRKSFYYSQKQRCSIGPCPKYLPQVIKETRFIRNETIKIGMVRKTKSGCSWSIKF